MNTALERMFKLHEEYEAESKKAKEAEKAERWRQRRASGELVMSKTGQRQGGERRLVLPEDRIDWSVWPPMDEGTKRGVLAYLNGAVDDELCAMENAQPGHREPTVKDGSWNLSRFCDLGIEEGYLEDLMVATGEITGLSESDAVHAISNSYKHREATRDDNPPVTPAQVIAKVKQRDAEYRAKHTNMFGLEGIPASMSASQLKVPDIDFGDMVDLDFDDLWDFDFEGLDLDLGGFDQTPAPDAYSEAEPQPEPQPEAAYQPMPWEQGMVGVPAEGYDAQQRVVDQRIADLEYELGYLPEPSYADVMGLIPDTEPQAEAMGTLPEAQPQAETKAEPKEWNIVDEVQNRVDDLATDNPDLAARIMPFFERYWWTRAIMNICINKGGTGPWALLGAVLVDANLQIPFTWQTPTEGSSNLFAVLVGPSGTGKTVAMRRAADAFNWRETPTGVMFSSGEGVVTQFIGPVPKKKEKDEDGNDIEQPYKDHPEYKTHAQLFMMDEITALLDVAARAGNTTVPILLMMFNGTEITFGSKTATLAGERLYRNSYRSPIIIGAQSDKVAELIALKHIGLPQRFVYLPTAWDGFTNDQMIAAWAKYKGRKMPTLPSIEGKIDIASLLPVTGTSDEFPQVAFRGCESIMQEKARRDGASVTIKSTDVASEEEELHMHDFFVRVKVATTMAYLEGSNTVTEQLWADAGLVMEVSAWLVSTMRKRIIERAKKAKEQRRVESAEDAAAREAGKAKNREQRVRARLNQKLLMDPDEPKRRRDLMKMFASGDDRDMCQQVLDELLASGAIIAPDERSYKASEPWIKGSKNDGTET